MPKGLLVTGSVGGLSNESVSAQHPKTLAAKSVIRRSFFRVTFLLKLSLETNIT